MPYSNKLANLDPTPSGTHAHLKCPFCDYKTRSDKIPKHVKDTHTLAEYELDTNYGQVRNIILISVEKNNGPLYPTGFCFDCFTYIKNKNGTTTDVFDKHECKERKEPAARKPVNKELAKEIAKAAQAETSFVLKVRLHKKLNSIFDHLEVDATEKEYEECVFDAIDSGVTAEADLKRERNLYFKLHEKYEHLETQFAEKVAELNTVRDSIEGCRREVEYARLAKEQFKQQIAEYDAENTELKRQLKALQSEEIAHE